MLSVHLITSILPTQPLISKLPTQPSHHFDYIIDAIDSITPKITFLARAYEQNIPIISSMGAGGKMDPTQLKVVDLSDTHTCPFAHQIRKNLRQQGITTGIKAVFSTEKADRDSIMFTDGKNYKKSAYGTISYLPATFGAVCASVAIRDLISFAQKKNLSIDSRKENA